MDHKFADQCGHDAIPHFSSFPIRRSCACFNEDDGNWYKVDLCNCGLSPVGDRMWFSICDLCIQDGCFSAFRSVFICTDDYVCLFVMAIYFDMDQQAEEARKLINNSTTITGYAAEWRNRLFYFSLFICVISSTISG